MMAVQDEKDLLENIDYSQLGSLPKDPFAIKRSPEPDYKEINGLSPEFLTGLSGAPAVQEMNEEETLETIGGFPHKVQPEYDPAVIHNDKDIQQPPPQAQGVAEPPKGVGPIIQLFPRTVIKRSPDGINILGLPLSANVPQQIVQGRAGLVEAIIYNIGGKVLYLCETYDECQTLVNAGVGGIYNAISLVPTEIGGVPSGTPFHHESEA